MRQHLNCFVLGCLVLGNVNAEDKALELAKSKAKSMLMFSKVDDTKEVCYTSLEAAKLKAKDGKPIVLWIGMECKDMPDLKSGLKNAVHCHLSDWNGSTEPMLGVVDKKGIYHFWTKDEAKTISGKDVTNIWENKPLEKRQ